MPVKYRYATQTMVETDLLGVCGSWLQSIYKTWCKLKKETLQEGLKQITNEEKGLGEHVSAQNMPKTVQVKSKFSVEGRIVDVQTQLDSYLRQHNLRDAVRERGARKVGPGRVVVNAVLRVYDRGSIRRLCNR